MTRFVVVVLALSMGPSPGLKARGSVRMEPGSIHMEPPTFRSGDAAELRAQGLAHGYNLDHGDAFAAFRRAIVADPTSPAGYRLLAGAAWTAILFEQGAVTIDDFLGEARARYQRPAPNAELARTFHEALDAATSLAERQLRERPNDPAARYQVGAAYGFRAAYAATVEGRLSGSFGPARRAYKEHERVLELAPARKDAGLIPGMYRYAVASLPAPLRLGAYLVGFGGGRERGVRLVEDAAAYPSEIRANAQFILVLLYNRESRFDEALRVIHELQRQFPRNRLLWLEEGSTALRAGRPAEARAALEEGIARFSRDTRPKAAGEESRWRYAHGAALAALHDTVAAGRELRSALELAVRDWLRGRIHKELGRVADLSGDRAKALDEYRQAERLCRADEDRTCVDEARGLMKRGGR